MRRGEAGFLLVEMLVALLVLAIVIGPLLGLLVLGVQTLSRAGQYTVAVNLAREKMEEVKGLGYGGAVSEVEDDAGGYTGMRREVVVAAAACGAGELRQVVVLVLWADGALEREVRLVTFVAGR